MDSQPLSTDVQTFGTIRAMFTADPLASTAGGWWRQAYDQPDVAPNHPSRWTIDTPGLTNPIPSNCLATGTGSSQMDCASLSTRSPADPWLSTFHGMRGFFISSGNFPSPVRDHSWKRPQEAIHSRSKHAFTTTALRQRLRTARYTYVFTSLPGKTPFLSTPTVAS